MSGVTSSEAMTRIAEIDQELALLESGSGARAAVDATRNDLTFWKDFLGNTAEELGEAKDEIESTVEGLTDPSVTTPGQPSVDELVDAVSGLGGDDSAIGQAIESGVEMIEGIASDFEGAGDVTPDSLSAGIGEFKESFQDSVSELLGGAAETAGTFKSILERDDIKDAIESVAGGVETGEKLFEGINEGVENIDKLLETIQKIDDLASGDGQAQLEALAELLETFTDKFGNAIGGIPGLGAFFTIYAKAFRGAAHSAGVIQGIGDRNNALYQIDREGRYLWITDAALRAFRIRDLKAERAKIFDASLAAARQERLDRAEAALHAPETPRDKAVEAAIRGAAGAQPALSSQAYNAWVESAGELDAAQTALGTARDNLDRTQQELAEAEITAARRDGGTDARSNEARVGMVESAVERAEARNETAGANFDVAQATHARNTEAQQAEFDVYDDAVRQGVIREAAKINNGNGFSDSDWFWFNSTYPQWRVSDTDLAPVVPLSQSDPVSAGTRVAVTSASTTWRRVAIGGGGFLAAAMVLAAVFWISNTGEVSTTAPPSNQQAQSETPEAQLADDDPQPTELVAVDPPASDASESNDPPAEEGASSINLIGSAGDVTCEDSGNTLDSALTIATATFVQDGDEIVVTITFEGDAEAYENATTDSFPFSVQFRLKEDTSGYPEVFSSGKGKLKVSGGLLQVVSHEFSGNKLTIRVKGRTLEDVQGVRVSTFVFAGGTCENSVESEGYNA